MRRRVEVDVGGGAESGGGGFGGGVGGCCCVLTSPPSMTQHCLREASEGTFAAMADGGAENGCVKGRPLIWYAKFG